MAANSIKVFIKVRPLITREVNENAASMWKISGNSLKSVDKQYDLMFDNIFDESKSTEQLFEELAKPIVTSALKGINGTIFAYGQTSSGKTYTMMGSDDNPGIIPRTVHEIFEQIEQIEDRTFLVRYGYIEIYNEKIFDLLSENKAECNKLHEPVPGEVTVNQVEVIASNERQIIESYENGNRVRRVGNTNMNEHSSRSHTIFRITIESREVGKTCEDSPVQVSSINLVDLAGSERVNQTKAEGERLKEGGHINKSLLALGNVIRILSDTQNMGSYVNYRDSKLTRMLSASIGGNAMTSIICTITPVSLDETYSTLVFAQNAKKIKNKPEVNRIMTDQAIMRRMEREIVNLKNQLEKERLRNSEVNMKEELMKQLMDKIELRETQFLQSHNITTAKHNEVARRRTWCSSMDPSIKVAIPPPIPQPVIPPFFNIPSDNHFEENLEDESFHSADDVNLDRTLSPGGRNTEFLTNMIKTPRDMKKFRENVNSPDVQNFESSEELQVRIKLLEEELQETNDFKMIETIINEDHVTLQQKLCLANDRIASLELKNEELESAVAAMNSDNLVKTANAERDKALKAKALAENILSSAEYEHEQFKSKAKQRESELIQTLSEARNEDEVEKLRVELRKAEEIAFNVVASQATDEIAEELTNKIAKLEDEIKLERAAFAAKFSQLETDLKAAHESQIKSMTEELADKVSKLSTDLETANKELNAQSEHRMSLQKALSEKSSAMIKLSEEYDEISTQLMDSIQENENTNKKLLAFEGKQQQIEKIMRTLANNEEPLLEDYENDDTISQLVQSWLETRDHKASHDGDEVTEEQMQQSELQKTIESKSNEIEQLSRQFSEKLEVIKDLEDSIETKNNRLKELEEKLSSQATDMSMEISDLKDGLREIMLLGEENARLKAVEKEHKQMVTDLTSRLKEAEPYFEKAKTVDDALAELEIFKQKCDELQSQIVVKESSIKILETYVEDKNREITEMQQNVNSVSVSNEVDDLKAQLDLNVKETNARLEAIEKEHQQTVNDLTTQLKEAEQCIEKAKAADDALAELEIFKQKCDELQSQIVVKESSIKILETYVEDKNREIAEMQQNVNSSLDSKEVDDLKAQLDLNIKETNARLEAIKKEHQQTVTELTTQLKEAEQYIEKAKAADDALEELDIVKKQLDTIQIQIEEKNREIEELQQNVSASSSSKEVNDLKEQLDFNIAEKSKLLAVIDSSNDDFQRQLKALSSKLADLEKDKNLSIVELNNVINNLNDQVKSLELQLSKLDAETTNMSSMIAIHEEELKTTRMQLKAKNDECEEIKTRLRRRSCDNDKKIQSLEREKSELVQTIGAVEAKRVLLEKQLLDQQAEQSKLTNIVIPKLNAEIVELKETFINSESLCKTLEQQLEQFRSAPSEVASLKLSLAKLENEKASLSKKIKELSEENIKSISELNDEREKLVLEIYELKNAATSKPASPEARASSRKSTDLYASQNQQLLLEPRSTPTRVLEKNFERKSRRQGVIDERRRLSSWERFIDNGCQTDNVSEICRCSELQEQIKQLQIEIRQKECKISTMKRLGDRNPLKLDIEEQKKLLAKEVRSHHKTKSMLDELTEKITTLEETVVHLKKNQKLPKMKTFSQSSQSDTNFVDKQERLKELVTVDKENTASNNARASEYKALESENLILKKKLQEIEAKVNEHQTDDTKSAVEKLTHDLEFLQKKYDMARRLCNLRNDDISKFKEELASQKEFLARLQDKYERTKTICDIRLEKINVLRQQVAEANCAKNE